MNKIALVTGANRGIGFEVCKQLASKGFKVILTARNEEKGKKALELLPKNVDFIKLDITNSSSIENATNIILKKYKKLDVLVNNAGIYKNGHGFDLEPMDDIKEMMNINVFGSIELTQSLIPLLKKSSDGRIINVSSGFGALNNAGSGHAGYRLSKTALNGFTAFLAKDLEHSNIKVNSVNPGWVKTDMGGIGAPRSVEKGAETIIFLATSESIPNGKFLQDKTIIDW